MFKFPPQTLDMFETLTTFEKKLNKLFKLLDTGIDF